MGACLQSQINPTTAQNGTGLSEPNNASIDTERNDIVAKEIDDLPDTKQQTVYQKKEEHDNVATAIDTDDIKQQRTDENKENHNMVAIEDKKQIINGNQEQNTAFEIEIDLNDKNEQTEQTYDKSEAVAGTCYVMDNRDIFNYNEIKKNIHTLYQYKKLLFYGYLRDTDHDNIFFEINKHLLRLLFDFYEDASDSNNIWDHKLTPFTDTEICGNYITRRSRSNFKYFNVYSKEFNQDNINNLKYVILITSKDTECSFITSKIGFVTDTSSKEIIDNENGECFFDINTSSLWQMDLNNGTITYKQWMSQKIEPTNGRFKVGDIIEIEVFNNNTVEIRCNNFKHTMTYYHDIKEKKGIRFAIALYGRDEFYCLNQEYWKISELDYFKNPLHKVYERCSMLKKLNNKKYTEKWIANVYEEMSKSKYEVESFQVHMLMQQTISIGFIDELLSFNMIKEYAPSSQYEVGDVIGCYIDRKLYPEESRVRFKKNNQWISVDINYNKYQIQYCVYPAVIWKALPTYKQIENSIYQSDLGQVLPFIICKQITSYCGCSDPFYVIRHT